MTLELTPDPHGAEALRALDEAIAACRLARGHVIARDAEMLRACCADARRAMFVAEDRGRLHARGEKSRPLAEGGR